MPKRKKSTQNLMELETFSKYGLQTSKAELAFFNVQPTNISVLSQSNIDAKIHHLMTVLSLIPELEIICLDSSECFDDNKQNIQKRLRIESNEKVRNILKLDLDFLDNIQSEMSTARQFLFAIRMKNQKPEQVFQLVNRASKTICDHGFEAKRMTKDEIKRMLAIYFETSMNGEKIEDIEGEEYFEKEDIIYDI